MVTHLKLVQMLVQAMNLYLTQVAMNLVLILVFQLLLGHSVIQIAILGQALLVLVQQIQFKLVMPQIIQSQLLQIIQVVLNHIIMIIQELFQVLQSHLELPILIVHLQLLDLEICSLVTQQVQHMIRLLLEH